jgi:hypothetical protein
LFGAPIAGVEVRVINPEGREVGARQNMVGKMPAEWSSDESDR